MSLAAPGSEPRNSRQQANLSFQGSKFGACFYVPLFFNLSKDSCKVLQFITVMASLSSIPEELLDNIIELVLLDERKPPADIESATPGRAATKRNRNGGILSWDYGPSNVRFETDSPPPATNALSLVNKYFHKQTTQTLSRIFPDGINYKLDAMFVNEAELWPTWLSVPAGSKQANTVDVTVRIFGRRAAGRRSAFMIGDGSPEQYVWLFYWLMEYFLRYGATSPETAIPKGGQQDITVKLINLNFVSGEPDLEPEDSREQYSEWNLYHDDFLRRQEPQPHTLTDAEVLAAGKPARMHPKWLANRLGGHLAGLPCMSYHAAAYGGIIHERIGSISISCNGENLRDIQPGNILALLQERPDSGSDWNSSTTFGHIGGDCRVLTFWNWKYAMVRRRKAVGLPVGETVVWPSLGELRGWRRARDEYRESSNGVTPIWKCSPGRCMCSNRDLEKMLEALEKS